MSDQQIAEAIAMKAMGWRRTFDGWIHPSIGWISFSHWNPARHIAQAFQVQAEIEKRGLEAIGLFESALMRETASTARNNARGTELTVAPWRLINASPRERCLAALKTVEAANR